METVLQVTVLSLVRVMVQHGLLMWLLPKVGQLRQRRTTAELMYNLLFSSWWLMVTQGSASVRAISIARLLWIIQYRRAYARASMGVALFVALVSLAEAWQNAWIHGFGPRVGPVLTEMLVFAMFLRYLLNKGGQTHRPVAEGSAGPTAPAPNPEHKPMFSTRAYRHPRTAHLVRQGVAPEVEYGFMTAKEGSEAILKLFRRSPQDIPPLHSEAEAVDMK
jgi:hypothetical protein